VVDFTVSDAQRRTGHGTLTIDVLGYPQTPASVTTIAYTPTSVTLLVNLGPASQAHPAVSGATIWQAGSPVATTCSPGGPGAYMCVVDGLVNGERHTYTARAVNSVGDSLDTTGHSTWSYQPPVITGVTAIPVYRSTGTTTTLGVMAVKIESSDDTSAFTVVNTHGTIARTGTITPAEISLGVGDQDLSIVPISKFTPPIAGDNSGAAWHTPVTVIGSPYYSGGISAAPNGPEITIAAPALNTNFNPDPGSQVWAAWTGPSTPGCDMANDGTAKVTGAGVVQSTTKTITGLVENKDYHFAVCGANGFGATMLSSSDTVLTWVPPAAPTGPNLAFTIAATASPLGGGGLRKTYRYDIQPGPSIASQAPFSVGYFYTGNATPQATFDTGYDVIQTPIYAAYCLKLGTPDWRCGVQAKLTPINAPTKVEVSFPRSCPSPMRKSDVQVTIAAAGDASISLGANSYTVSWPASSPYGDLVPVTFSCTGPPPGT
jgi:hypothetical protein